jgi:hypothetical protein
LHGREGNAERILVGEPENNRTFRKPIHRRRANIKIEIKEREWEILNCIYMSWSKE